MTLWLALASGKDFGWGVCGEAIRRSVGAVRRVKLVDRTQYTQETKVDGVVLHTIKDEHFNREVPIWGDVNWGYTFNEFSLPKDGIEEAQKFDGVFAGSTWCKELLESHGVKNVHVLVQGVDQGVFNDSPVKPRCDGKFRLFSGGKFEYRKGQDVVIEAFRRVQKRHKNLELVTAWWNPWVSTVATMQLSPHIDYLEYREGMPWGDYAFGVCAINLLYPNRLYHYDRIPHDQISQVMKQTDCGLFLSRCEGGTNLVMMEYMACGKPAIVSGFTGHLDVVKDTYALTVPHERELTLAIDGSEAIAHWYEPDIQQVVERIDYIVENRDAFADHWKDNAKAMRKWTWERTAQTIVEVMEL